MNRTRVRLVRLLLIILLLLLAVFLILSSDRLRPKPYGNEPTSLIEHRPQDDITVPSQTEEPQPIATSSPASPAEDELPGKSADLFIDVTGSNPHSTLFQAIRTGSKVTTNGVRFSNYLNAVRTLHFPDGTMEFKDDDFYTFTGSDRTSHTYRISDYVDLQELFSGQSLATEGSWFFLGALETRDSLYVAYDFWSVDELTLFFRMDKSGLDASLVYATQYDEQRNAASFAASNESIFYIYTTQDAATGAIESSLLQADSDGNKSGLLLPLADGYSAHHLNLTENALIFMITSPQGVTSLVRLDTLTHELTYIAEACRVCDYLYLYQNYALVGTSGSSLVLYRLDTRKELLIPLGEAQGSALGLPVCNASELYLQYFRWDANADTTLLRIDVENGTATPFVLQKNKLSYVTGITEDSLYAESAGEYIQFPIP